MGKLDKLRRKVLDRPTEMPLTDVQRVLEAAGWTMRQGKGSHVVFTKAGRDSIPMRVEDGKVNRAAIADAAKEVGQPGE